jgi:hypothetical protein
VPLVPVTVSVNVPVLVLAVVETVRVEFAGGVTEAWLNEQLAPVGQPETVRLTALLNPFWEVTVTVEVPCWPCGNVSDAGLAEIEKFGAGGAPQLMNLKEPTKVAQLNVPLLGWYWFVYQKVQSSLGSMRMAV